MDGPKYHITTFGCQMNHSDSERVVAVLENMGMRRADGTEDADVILFNSCSVRQSAEDRIFGGLHNLEELKARRPDLIIAVTGCLPGRDTDGALRRKMPLADLFFPIRDLPQLPRWLAGLNPGLAPCDLEDDYLKITPKYSRPWTAYVPVQSGCNKFCTYCVVPYSRGLERNRPAADIIGEIRSLAEGGAIEIHLVGQAVNAYKAEDPSSFSAGNPYGDHFAALLWEINRIPGIERIHFTAPHPVHVTDEMIDALALPKHVNYLHLPVQSGSDEVLRRMNRRYTAAQYLDIVARLRKRNPGIALGTDIIVGFCGETDAQFRETVGFYKAADFDISYTAMYSTRSGTVASKVFKDDVARFEKKRRWRELEDLMERTTLRKNQAYQGREVEVLVDSFEKGFCSGQTREMKLARFRSDEDLRGKVVRMTVTDALMWVLDGERDMACTAVKQGCGADCRCAA